MPRVAQEFLDGIGCCEKEKLAGELGFQTTSENAAKRLI
jgi:hypothetical protein